MSGTYSQHEDSSLHSLWPDIILVGKKSKQQSHNPLNHPQPVLHLHRIQMQDLPGSQHPQIVWFTSLGMAVLAAMGDVLCLKP